MEDNIVNCSISEKEILRISTVWGEGGLEEENKSYLKNLTKNRSLVFVPQLNLSLVHIEDVLAKIFILIENKKYHTGTRVYRLYGPNISLKNLCVLLNSKQSFYFAFEVPRLLLLFAWAILKVFGLSHSLVGVKLHYVLNSTVSEDQVSERLKFSSIKKILSGNAKLD